MMRALLLLLACGFWAAPRQAILRGEVVDAATGKPLPCRVTIRGADGKFYFAKSAAPDGSAIEYRKVSGTNKSSVENHVTLSAHSFTVALPPGKYTVHVQRGKEYLPETKTVDVDADGSKVEIKLRRWIHMADRGWFSGDTHVHRMPDQLPNLQLAEDLNVALPLTSWVTEAHTAPGSANKAGTVPNDAKVTEIDPTHVFWSRNTEYEIFSVDKKRHTLGALFILNQKTLFETGVPPVGPIVKQARAEGALLELDKHNWPWSMMLAPVFDVDLYELANNHMWETEFGFKDFGSPAPDYMKIEKDASGMTEKGWIDYTFQNYYALLNCDIRMKPTAGCASGVHPVPLGFGRVYVQIEGPFSYEKWIQGLKGGRSFVTTGPMLFVNGMKHRQLSITAESAFPISRMELVINGDVIALPRPENKPTPTGGFVSSTLFQLKDGESHWVAARCYEDRPDGRIRWAHSAPVYADVENRPIRPRRGEVEFLIKRIEDEIARNTGVLPEAAMAEYRQALEFYKGKLATAR